MNKLLLSLTLVITAFGAACPPAVSGDDGPAECREGSRDCACDDSRCDDGLVCQSGTCRVVATSGLRVLDANARACEVLVSETGGVLTEVTFAAEVTGRTIREGNKVAVAFTANGDASIGGNDVVIGYAGQVERIDQALSLGAARCFDKSGAALTGSALSF